MGFLQSAGVWVGSEGNAPSPLPLRSVPRPVSVTPISADSLLPVVNSIIAHSWSARPQPAPKPGRTRFSASPPIEYGDFDDTYLPAYAAQLVHPPRRLPVPPLRQPAAEPPSIQQQIDQTIDFIACYTSPAPRLPRIPPDRQPNQTRTGDPHPFTQRDETEWGVVFAAQQTRPWRPLRPRPVQTTSLVRDSEQDDYYLAWAGQGIRPAALPQRRGQSGSNQVMLLDEFEYFFGQQTTPPRRSAFQFRANVAPPWLSMISIAVPGPFYVVAGQVSPAAGAVMGEVRAAGED